MTPDQAMQIVDTVTGLAPINRQDQQNTMTAIAVLRSVVESFKAGVPPVGPKSAAGNSTTPSSDNAQPGAAKDAETPTGEAAGESDPSGEGEGTTPAEGEAGAENQDGSAQA